MNPGKRFVYLLRSGHNPRRHYVGLTSDVRERLERYCGPSISTAVYFKAPDTVERNWQLGVYECGPDMSEHGKFVPTTSA